MRNNEIDREREWVKPLFTYDFKRFKMTILINWNVIWKWKTLLQISIYMYVCICIVIYDRLHLYYKNVKFVSAFKLFWFAIHCSCSTFIVYSMFSIMQHRQMSEKSWQPN